ncbi:MAG: stage II sporulation protein E [Clostridia bacterium]|nr:stage II sporulation protein E [Clostridia bacterium]
MAELEISRYNAPKNDKSKRTKVSKNFSKQDWIIRALGFFLAMAMPYGEMAPFGLSFLAQERKLSGKTVLSLVAVSLGSMAVCDRMGSTKYIGAAIIYIAVLFVLENGVALKPLTAGIAAGASVVLSGLVTVFWEGFTFGGLFLLLIEAVVTVFGALVFEKSAKLLKSGKLVPEKLGTEEKLSIGAVLGIAVLSLREIYIGTNFSVMNSVAAGILLVISASCGMGYSTGAGVVLGIICGIGSDFFLPVLGAFCFCGFLAGLFSRFGKGGTIAGVILANAVLVVYTDGAMESMLTLYEIMAAAVAFSFVKPKVLLAVEEVVCLDAAERAGIKKIKENLRARLRSIAVSFEAMAKTLERLSDKSNQENSGDIATFFDMAADKVCKKCRKSGVCWGKDFDFTYKSLFRLMETMDEKGILNPSDAEPLFKTRCIDLPRLVEELNHQLSLHQVRRVWQSKLKESRSLVGEQLFGVSNIIGNLSEEIESDIRFDDISGKEIKLKLSENGIKVKHIETFREQQGRHRVELTIKRDRLQRDEIDETKKVMKNIFRGEIHVEEKYPEDERYLKLQITEAERYRVETDFAEKAASEENGDNYRFSHISGGKYVIALSDGMGTGSRAARESQAMLELLDSFLRAGFDSRTAVKFINSVMLLKSDEEAFVTIDICIIDLYTGEAEFIKTGAEPSFILQKTGVNTVKAASLPVGVIAEMEAERTFKTITDGDVIVMVTDGVETRDNGSMWVSEFLEEARSMGEEKNLAEKILSKAIENQKGEITDDMTVLSVRLKEVS